MVEIKFFGQVSLKGKSSMKNLVRDNSYLAFKIII